MKFDKILVPVDFSINSEIALRKALTLCDFSGSIYLFHVFTYNTTTITSFYNAFTSFVSYNDKSDIGLAIKKLSRLKKIAKTIRSDIEIIDWINVSLSVQNAVIESAKKIGANLIIIGKSSRHLWFPFLNTIYPYKVAKLTGIPVLTMKPGSSGSPIKTVVVPVGEQFPESKISILNLLQKKFHIHIKLVFFLNRQNDPVILPKSLLNVYRALKNNPKNNVVYDTLYGTNKAKAVLAYCIRVKADLLVVYPESETRIGWLNKQISDVLSAQSKTQILSIQPYKIH